MYKKNFLRLVGIGTLYFTETFSFSMSFIHDGPIAAAAPLEVPQDMIDAFTTLWGAPGIVSTGARLTTIKLNEIGTDGHYANDETILHDFPDIGIAGAYNNFVAPQLAYCVSLATAKSRGRAVRGRFYLPVPGGGVANTGTVDVAGVQNFKAHVDTFLKDLQGTVPGWRLGIVSDIGTGYENVVTHARYGRVLDTIRSRRASISEEYAEGSPIPAP